VTDVTRSSARRRPPRRRRPWLRPLLVALALLLVFVLGVALGQTTASDPGPGGPGLTTVRTVVPVTAPQQTVTVTTTVPRAP
jgi:hypothetical protein